MNMTELRTYLEIFIMLRIYLKALYKINNEFDKLLINIYMKRLIFFIRKIYSEGMIF